MVHKAIEGCHQKHFQSSLSHQEVYYPDPDQKVVGKVDRLEFLLLVVNPVLMVKVSPALLMVVGKVDHLVLMPLILVSRVLLELAVSLGLPVVLVFVMVKVSPVVNLALVVSSVYQRDPMVNPLLVVYPVLGNPVVSPVLVIPVVILPVVVRPLLVERYSPRVEKDHTDLKPVATSETDYS